MGECLARTPKAFNEKLPRGTKRSMFNYWATLQVFKRWETKENISAL